MNGCVFVVCLRAARVWAFVRVGVYAMVRVVVCLSVWCVVVVCLCVHWCVLLCV